MHKEKRKRMSVNFRPKGKGRECTHECLSEMGILCACEKSLQFHVKPCSQQGTNVKANSCQSKTWILVFMKSFKSPVPISKLLQ
jgi:hypothetical protein